jgi:hypothetical protein
MTGGEISGNTANLQGGGVYVTDGCAFTVSGSPVVADNTNLAGMASNVYLPSGKAIAVNGLSTGASVGVTTENAPTASTPVTIATGASAGYETCFFSDDSSYNVERDGSTLLLAGGMSEGFTDPEGREIEDPVLIDWLSANNFTQSDINALGSDSAATDKLYECWLLNCSITAANPGGALSITGFAVSNDVVSVTVQLVRQSPLGYINGALYLYGANDLSVGFGDRPISEEIVDFRDGDSIFDTLPASGLVTQTVTATFDAFLVSEKFFKAKIEFPRSDEPDEPWEPDPEEVEE